MAHQAYLEAELELVRMRGPKPIRSSFWLYYIMVMNVRKQHAHRTTVAKTESVNRLKSKNKNLVNLRKSGTNTTK